MELINRTQAVIIYEGAVYGPGKVIPYTDEHAAGRDVTAMLEAGHLEPALGKKAPSEGLTVEQLKEALTAKGVEFKPDAKKAELAGLLDAAA